MGKRIAVGLLAGHLSVMAALNVQLYASEGPAPIAAWSMDLIENGVVPDRTGKHPGTVKGSPQPVSGVEGGALKFNGTTDYLTVPDAPDLSFTRATFSLSVWVNVHSVGRGQQMIIGKNVYAARQREWSLMVDQDDLFRLYISSSGKWQKLGSKTRPVPGQWYHLAVTLDSGQARLYVNGIEEGSEKRTTSIEDTDAPLTMGGIYNSGELMQMFAGALDEVQVFNRALKPAEIKTLADRSGPAHDVSEPAADHFKIWTGPDLPNRDAIPLLGDVTFHQIKAHEPDLDGGYHWLHGVALVWHNGKLYASFGHNKGQENTASEEARGCVSDDGGASWGPLFTIRSGDHSLGVSHGVFLSHEGTLWSFHGAFYDDFQRTHTRAYRLNQAETSWDPVDIEIENGDGFWPMQEPLKMEDGNWIMSGIRVARKSGVPGLTGDLPAAAISRGNDLTRWELVVIEPDPNLPAGRVWGESTVFVEGSQVRNISRWGAEAKALVSESTDYGKTWAPFKVGNLPMATSKPYTGTLSDGRHYLICSISADGGTSRRPLTIALTRPGEMSFSSLYVIRHASGDGLPDSSSVSALSYPYAVEQDGKLYVGYSNSGGRRGNNNSAELAVIPLSALR